MSCASFDGNGTLSSGILAYLGCPNPESPEIVEISATRDRRFPKHDTDHGNPHFPALELLNIAFEWVKKVLRKS